MLEQKLESLGRANGPIWYFHAAAQCCYGIIRKSKRLKEKLKLTLIIAHPKTVFDVFLIDFWKILPTLDLLAMIIFYS